MVDPFNITAYDRTTPQLQELLLFCVFVAGKPARRTAAQLEEFLAGQQHRPFAYVRDCISKRCLRRKLEKYGFGQYTRLLQSLKELTSARLNLSTATVEDLTAIHGIGAKTAAFFITHSRPPVSIEVDEVILDTHNMKHIVKNAEWLVGNGHLSMQQAMRIPKNTPGSRTSYRLFSECYRALVRRDSPNGTMADYDLRVWKSYAVA
jgi:hypothetical protein